MRLNRILGLTMGAMLTAGAAQAGTVTVTYDLNNSVLNILTPLSIPNAADITGTAVLTFTANDVTQQIIDGPVSLDSVVVNVNLGVGGLAATGLSGIVTTTLIPPASSTLTGNTLADAPATFSLTGTINCTPGTTCALLGLPPSTVLNTTSSLALTNGEVNPTTAPSHLTGEQALNLSLGALNTTGTVLLDGIETGRVFVPEPGTVMLVGMGLVGLAALGRKRA